jgi:hypothetical protein
LTSWSIFSSVPEPSEFPLTNLQAGKSYAVTISVDSLDRMTGDSEIETSISDARGVVAAKTLNLETSTSMSHCARALPEAAWSV